MSYDDPNAMARAAAVELKRIADETKRFAVDAAEEMKTIRKEFAAADARMLGIEQKMARRPGGAPARLSTLGEAVVASEEFKSLAASSGQRGQVRIGSTRDVLETKNITSVAGSGAALIPPDYRADVVALPYRRLAIRDLVAPGETTANAVTYPKMTARTNNAAPVAEGALKPQSDLAFNLVTTPVSTLAHFFVGSRQMLDDAPALRSLIDTEAQYGLRLVEDSQMLYGDGTGQNLLGLMPQASVFAAPFPVAAATPLDTLIQAIAQVEAQDLECDGMVLNVVDWRKMMAQKDAQGRYLSAGPFGPENSRRLWDLPVVTTNNLTKGQFLVGAFKSGAQIFDRMSVEVLVSTEHADFFVRNLIAIRAEERLAFTVKRPNAFVAGTYPTGT